MKKRIYRAILSVSLASVALAVALTLWSFYGLLLHQARTDLMTEYTILERTIAYTGKTDLGYLADLDKQYYDTRMTIVSRDGSVLYDSTGEQGEMENHLNRPEIHDAFQKGSGMSLRESETRGQSTYYYAKQLDNDRVLRISKETRSIGAVFISIMPLLIGIVLLIIALSLFLASRLTRRIVSPIERLSDDLETAVGSDCYEEMDPFFRKIEGQKRFIQEQMTNLRTERDTINLITSNMKEGLILLDLEKSVLSVNPAALKMLKAFGEEYEGKNLIMLSRDLGLSECVGKALDGVSADTMIDKRDGEQTYQAFVSPVCNKEAVCGAIVLLLDVTERQKAENIRKEFTANVSHELKTPLTSISGFAEMIESGMVHGEDEMKKCAARICKESARLITLTDDIIRLSRIEAEAEPEKQQLDLLSICNSAVEELSFAAKQKGVEITATGENFFICANLRMMEELAYNLIDNAIKYNINGGHVDINVCIDGREAVFTVADSGIGIPDEFQERIFERFYRVDKSRSKQTGGTGLGLSIVKHIAECHRGAVSIESHVGAGTKITVKLPLN